MFIYKTLKSIFLFCLLTINSFALAAFPETVLDQDCNQKIIGVKPQKDLAKMTVDNLVFALSDYAFRVLPSCRKPEASEQVPCLKDYLSDNSFNFNNIDKEILAYMTDNFESLRGVFVIYDQEKNRCNQYYSYGGLGYCIPHTGRECLNKQGLMRKVEVSGAKGMNYYRCIIGEFLTPEGAINKKVIEGTNCHLRE